MSTVCKRSSLIAIVNRLYMNANSDPLDDDVTTTEVKEEESGEAETTSLLSTSRESSKTPEVENAKIIVGVIIITVTQKLGV